MKYTSEDIENIAIKMEKYGGKFVKHLAQVIRAADPDNLEILKNSFKDYFDKYFNFGKEKEDKKNEKP